KAPCAWRGSKVSLSDTLHFSLYLHHMLHSSPVSGSDTEMGKRLLVPSCPVVAESIGNDSQ
ncbi:hypothetical protein JOB18_044107, partial [Solea senegalensis]